MRHNTDQEIIDRIKRNKELRERLKVRFDKAMKGNVDVIELESIGLSLKEKKWLRDWNARSIYNLPELKNCKIN